MLIGPEGDFTPHEIDMALQNGFKALTLGESRLRTETAALAACFEANFLNR
jgi:16S rRNA (uracil1498-N3)-methyltransferase